MGLIEDVLTTVGLFCPDDRARLELQQTHLACSSCRREFPVFNSRIIELLPRTPQAVRPPVSGEYVAGYRQELSQPFAIDDAAMAWGSPEGVPREWMKKRQRQVTWCRRLLTHGHDTG